MEKVERHVKIVRLILKQRLQVLTDEERELINQWRQESEINEKTYTNLQKVNVVDLDKRYSRVDVEKQWHKFANPRRSLRFVSKVLALSACLCGIVLGGLMCWKQVSVSLEKPILAKKESKSIRLRLATGETINLDARKEGNLTKGVVLHANRTLEYLSDTLQRADSMEWNTLTIPRGAFFHLTLSDGTIVWLNADTRIIYPTVFSKEKREVSISGEAYFQVAKNPEVPFIVKTDQFDVRVLGTVFNVNTYDDNDKAFTALVEGSVRIVSKFGDSCVIKPGQVAELDREGGKLNIFETDLRPYMEWKDQQFCFRNSSIRDILKQIGRYYDVNVVYATDFEEEHYTGNISRTVPLEDVLQVLEASTAVKFEIKEKNIFVKRRRD